MTETHEFWHSVRYSTRTTAIIQNRENEGRQALKQQAKRQSREHMQALAALTDQRDRSADQPKRGLLARLGF